MSAAYAPHAERRLARLREGGRSWNNGGDGAAAEERL